MVNISSLEGAAMLPHWGLIRAQGADAATFLQGQLTSDFLKLDAAQARLAGYCTAKGRLLASFIGWKPSEDTVMLMCRSDVLAATLKRLSMFVMRAKCKLSDASDEFSLRGLAGPSAAQWLGDGAPPSVWSRALHVGADVIRLPDSSNARRYIWIGGSGITEPALPALDTIAWQRSEIDSGIVSIEAATVDQFVPQMVNFEAVGGVDFKKGCYPGQEVVARSQYRGTTKRRTFLFSSDVALSAGQEIFHSEDPTQPAGLVANAAAGHLLAEVKLCAMASGTLHAGTPEGPRLRPLPQPYELPADAG